MHTLGITAAHPAKAGVAKPRVLASSATPAAKPLLTPRRIQDRRDAKRERGGVVLNDTLLSSNGTP
jgi:hypothetical protein